MIEYKCDECGAVFTDPAEIIEDTGEKWAGCPSCGCTSLIEGVSCGCCGEFTEDGYSELCENCRADLDNQLLAFILDLPRAMRKSIWLNGIPEFSQKELNLERS